jgi:hypothetical protein
MASHIERRKFLATLGGAAASEHASQQGALPVVDCVVAEISAPPAGHLAIFFEPPEGD